MTYPAPLILHLDSILGLFFLNISGYAESAWHNSLRECASAYLTKWVTVVALRLRNSPDCILIKGSNSTVTLHI